MPPTNTPSRIRDHLAQILAALVGALLVGWILIGAFLILLPSPTPDDATAFEQWSYRQRAHQAIEEARQRAQPQGVDK